MKTLYEGILKGMDDTLKSGNADVTAAMSDMIINGITSYDAKDQKNAVEAFVTLLANGDFPKCSKVSEFTNPDRNSYPWYIQFKKDNRVNWYDFALIKKIGSYFYIVSIDAFGNKPVYDRQSTVKGAFNYVSFKDSIIYKVEDNIEEIDKICDKILRIMYMR